jgi:aldehyde:ferredoxin oxidoreductase
MADELGLDTISLGSCLGFAMEASEKGLIPEKIEWGDFQIIQNLIVETAKREGLGKVISQGVRATSEVIGKDSYRWAMHVKGLEISAYNCHANPAMALSYATCPVGAAHKDAWIIGWEISTDRSSYGKEKVEKLIELQRIRGGILECLTICRLPFVELDFGYHKIPEYMEAVTGNRFDWEDSCKKIGDRVYSLIRAYWTRENSQFNRNWDYPPDRWFNEPQSQGKLKGITLDREKYNQMLSWYYELRGWDQNGIPTKETLINIGLREVFQEMMNQNG